MSCLLSAYCTSSSISRLCASAACNSLQREMLKERSYARFGDRVLVDHVIEQGSEDEAVQYYCDNLHYYNTARLADAFQAT